MILGISVTLASVKIVPNFHVFLHVSFERKAKPWEFLSCSEQLHNCSHCKYIYFGLQSLKEPCFLTLSNFGLLKKTVCLTVLSKGVCKRSLDFTVNFVNNIKGLGFVMMQCEIVTASINFVYFVRESNKSLNFIT